MKMYRQISNIWRTLSHIEIVYHSDVVGTSPDGAAPTTSSFSTEYLVSINCAKTTARRDERHLSVVIWCISYKRFDGSWKWHRFIKFTSQNLTVLHNQYGCWCPWHTGSPGISVVLTLTWTTWNISMTILPIYFSFQACISIASQQWAKSLYDTMLVQISDVTGRNELIYFWVPESGEQLSVVQFHIAMIPVH